MDLATRTLTSTSASVPEAFSIHHCMLSHFSRVQLMQPQRTHQAHLSTGFPRQEYWSGVPFPSPEDLPDPGIQPKSPALADKCFTIAPCEKPILINSLSKPSPNSKIAILTFVFAQDTEQISGQPGTQVQASPRAPPRSSTTTASTPILPAEACHTVPWGLPLLRQAQLCGGRLPLPDLCLPQCSS